MNWYLVLGKQSKTTEQAYSSLELAQAKQVQFAIEYPELGPWNVVPLMEVTASILGFTKPTTTGTPVTRDEE